MGLLIDLNKLNKETLPILDEILQARIEQFHQALAANIEDLTALVDRLEAAIAALNGTSLILNIPHKTEKEINDEKVNGGIMLLDDNSSGAAPKC